MWQLAIGGGGALVGAIVALVFLVQRNSARYEASQEKQRADGLDEKLAIKTAEAADSWARLSAVINDLKKENLRLGEALNAYADKDPKLAGDILSGVLSPEGDAGKSKPVSSGEPPGGTVSPLKPS